MGIEATHPEYDAMACEWETIRDAACGEAHVKKRYDLYLPPTTGMAPEWTPANRQSKGRTGIPVMKDEKLGKYLSYVMRAEFPDDMTNMLDTAQGLLWNKDATIELPKRLEYLLDHATQEGESLQEFMMRVTMEQLSVQRCGIMWDWASKKTRGIPRPYLCMYTAETITNWDNGSRRDNAYSTLNMVVLKESGNTRQVNDVDPFRYDWQEQYRVLFLGRPATNEAEGVYSYGVFNEKNYDQASLVAPTLLGRSLPFIPFYFINGRHCLPCIERPRALALANKCFSTYRTSADYEQQLHEQAQETLVLEGGDPKKTYAIGSGAVLTPGEGQKAYFIGLSGNGLPEMCKAYQNKKVELMQMSGQLVDVRSLQRESGEALSTRVAGQTATLASIAKVLGHGMTRCLRDLAFMLGEDPKKVNIRPNTNFISPELFAKTLVELMQAKNMGYPITYEDMHRLAQERGISTKDFQSMMKILEKENPPIMATGTPTGNPGGLTPKQLTPPAPAGGAPATKSARNPTGTSARGKTKKNTSKKK